MEADIMTKPITKADYWRTARLNISIAFDKEASWKEPRPVATPRIAAPATILRPRYLFEFCCGENSKLGIHAGDCIVVRLTAAHDMTSETGLAYALAKVDEAIQADGDILLWSSMPCTGGSPWQNINKRHESARAKIKEHINLFNKLWVSFVKMATYVKSASSHAHIAMEWPKGCSYWRLRKVECFVKEFLPLHCICNGCMVELRSIKNGKLIAKPWSIKTDCIEITEAFAGYTCNHEATMHHPCEGQDTKLSEEHTIIMVNLIHDGYRQATKTACTKTDSPQQDRLKNQIKATALCATTAMSGSGSSSVWQTAAFADREVPWDQWLRTTLRQALQIYYPGLTQSFGSGNCCLVETAKMLQVLYSKSASHFMWCSGVKMAPVLAADGNVVPPMREKDVTLSGVKAVVVGDSFLTMLKKVVRKSDGATCERELQEVSGSLTVKVMAEGGAQIRDLIRLTQAALEAGNQYIVLCWMGNDFFEKRQKRATSIRKDYPKEIDPLIAELAILLNRFKAHIVLFGGNSSAWGVDPRFDAYCDESRRLMSSLAINHIPGNQLVNVLECSADDRWHSLRNDHNAGQMAQFFTCCLQFLRKMEPPAEYQVLTSKFGFSWFAGTEDLQLETEGWQETSRASGDAELALPDNQNYQQATALRKVTVNSAPEFIAGPDSIGEPMVEDYDKDDDFVPRSVWSVQTLPEPLPVEVAPAASSSASSTETRTIRVLQPTAKTMPATSMSAGGDTEHSRDPRMMICSDSSWQPEEVRIPSQNKYGMGRWFSGWGSQSRFSITMSMILRYAEPATRAKLGIGKDGFAEILAFMGALRERRELPYISSKSAVGDRELYDMIATAVALNQKSRFQLLQKKHEDTVVGIRAVQGHEFYVDPDSVMTIITAKTCPGTFMHMTSPECLPGIIREGLKPGGPRAKRSMICAAPYRFGDSRLKSGARFYAAVETLWDPVALLQNPSYMTASGAICTPHPVSPIFLISATNVHTGLVLFDREAVVDREAAGGDAEREVPTSAPSASSTTPADFIPAEAGGDTVHSPEEAAEKTIESPHEDIREDAVGDFGGEEEERLPDTRELCTKCGFPFENGVLLCTSCGNLVKPQPADAKDNSAQVIVLEDQIRREFGVEVNLVAIKKLFRTPYTSRARKLRKSLLDYDKKAVKGRWDKKAGVMRYYKDYEDRFQRDPIFRWRMSQCKPPRDLNFRALIESLEVVHKRTGVWKEDLAARLQRPGFKSDKRKASSSEGPQQEGKGAFGWTQYLRTGPGGEKGKGAPAASPPQTQWQGAPWWAGTAAWWSGQWWQADAASNAVTKRASGNTVLYSSMFQIHETNYIKMMLAVIAVLALLALIYKVINAILQTTCCRKCRRIVQIVLYDENDTELYAFRTVGVQSQCTHDGLRFKAHENGFKRAGEVTIELHRHGKKAD